VGWTEIQQVLSDGIITMESISKIFNRIGCQRVNIFPFDKYLNDSSHENVINSVEVMIDFDEFCELMETLESTAVTADEEKNSYLDEADDIIVATNNENNEISNGDEFRDINDNGASDKIDPDIMAIYDSLMATPTDSNNDSSTKQGLSYSQLCEWSQLQLAIQSNIIVLSDIAIQYVDVVKKRDPSDIQSISVDEDIAVDLTSLPIVSNNLLNAKTEIIYGDPVVVLKSFISSTQQKIFINVLQHAFVTDEDNTSLSSITVWPNGETFSDLEASTSDSQGSDAPLVWDVLISCRCGAVLRQGLEDKSADFNEVCIHVLIQLLNLLLNIITMFVCIHLDLSIHF
jgi:hypothetical protein